MLCLEYMVFIFLSTFFFSVLEIHFVGSKPYAQSVQDFLELWLKTEPRKTLVENELMKGIYKHME